MIVGIIGSGGREHAICTKIKESSKTDKIFCIPGNAGTNDIAENIDIKIDDFKSIKNFCLKSKIELLIVGPEKPIDETEAQAIYDFVTKEGGKVVVAADNSNANTLESTSWCNPSTMVTL